MTSRPHAPRSPTRFPRVLLTLGSAVALSAASAQPLDAYLARASETVAVVRAELDRGDAERARARVESDPLALRLERTQARQRADLTAAEADEALLEAYRSVATAWARVREAELQVALASASRDLAARTLQIARLRQERGSATVLDVQTASTELLDAERLVRAATDGLALARADLAGVTGLGAAPSDTVPRPFDRSAFEGLTVPDEDALEAAALRVPVVLQLQHAVELTELAVASLDPSFAARRQIEEAQLQREQASAAEREARRGITLRTRSLANALGSAIEGDRIAQEALAQAREREDVERRRLEAGLIAEIAFDAVQLQTRQAELRAVQAEHALIDAVLALQAGARWPIAGWHGY